MMSKNSFLVSLKENNKRRIWVWMVSALIWFFFYPVGMALLMSRGKNINLIEGLTQEASKARLLEEAGAWLSVNGGVAVIVSILAVICAIQGFSYLYSRKKVDLYHSVPVKKSRRFMIIYLNGILIYLIPNLISVILAIAVAALNGAVDGNMIQAALIMFGMNLLLYLGTYGLTVLAVMLTGKMIITLLGVCVFLFYEMAVKMEYIFFQSEFYDYFSDRVLNFHFVSSPMSQYVEMMNGLKQGGVTEPLCIGMVLAVGFFGLAYLCYRLRPAEAAGKTMAFVRTKSVIKFLIVVPASLMITFIVKSIVGDGKNSTAPIIFAMIISVVLVSSLMEVIYEADIRAAFRKKYQMFISGACAAGIYCIFCFDLTGFDAWVPKPEELEEAVIAFGYDEWSYIDAELSYVEGMEYRLAQPGIKEIEAICELSKRKVTDEEDSVWIEIAYRMKDGNTIWRRFPVSGTETELLNQIIGSNEYKVSRYQLADDLMYEEICKYKIKEITYSNGFRIENLAVEDLDMLREAFLKDLEQLDYSTYRDELCSGQIDICVTNPKNRREAWIGFELYPSYTNTIQLLKERGIYHEKYFELEEIASITVTNYHHDLQQQAYEDARATGDVEAMIMQMNVNFEVHKTFTDETQIRELAEAIYPSGFTSYWKAPGVISNDYYVTIQYKNEETDSAYYRGSNDAELITRLIPSWLETETAYK